MFRFFSYFADVLQMRIKSKSRQDAVNRYIADSVTIWQGLSLLPEAEGRGKLS